MTYTSFYDATKPVNIYKITVLNEHTNYSISFVVKFTCKRTKSNFLKMVSALN